MHTGHTNAADNLAIDHDRDAAFHQVDVRHGEIPQPRAASRNDIFKRLGRPTKLDRGAGPDLALIAGALARLVISHRPRD
jgi:hypothetical protein